MSRTPKIQRLTDLIAALLRRNYPATFEVLARDVPAYADESKKRDAVMRMFERDKDELRSFGIAIDTVTFEDESGEASGYRLDRKSFYLPYLSLASREGKSASQPRRPTQYGYRTLASLVIEPDELAMIVEAASRVRALGDPVLRSEAESAMRKLAFDLPLPPPRNDDSSLPPASPDVFEALHDALARRKCVTITYHSIGSDEVGERTVEPYGLFFTSSHWYLAARDEAKGDVRNFRLSRISDAVVNQSRSQTADYSIPADFRLREHAQSRKAWEIGDGTGLDALVEFRDPSGAAKAASRLGVAVEGPGDRRRFQFRRIDSFARWLLSFGGEALPLEPRDLVAEFERQLRETRAVYASQS